MRTQLGAYYETLSNFQAQFASELFPSQNILQNATGKSKIKGLEASLQAHLGAMSLDFAATFLDSELGRFPRVFVTPPPPFTPYYDDDLTHANAPFSPKFTLNVGGSYRIALGNEMFFTPRVDIAHVANQNGAVFEQPFTLIPKRTLINAALRLEKDKWYGEAYSTNLTDKRYVAGIQDLGNIWYPGAPRQYGLRAGVNF